jgi:hypothetical protein
MANHADLNAKVAGLLKSHQDGTGIVSACKQLLAMLVDAKVLYKLTIPSLLVGVHPTNRDGYGVNAMDVHTLMDDIFSIGWDSAKVSALCVEVGSQDEQAIKQFNQKLVRESNGLLAPDHIEQMRYSSLWGGHTNQILRAIKCGVCHSNPDMCVDGLLDVHKVMKHDPDFGAAVMDGVQWLVIPSWLLQAHPTLATFLQSAGNAPGQVSKPEHEMQMLRKIHNCCMELRATSPQGRVSFEQVKSRVLKSKPPCASALPGMFNFVVRHGGGSGAVLLLETEAFIRSHSASMVNLSPEMWEALAHDIKAHNQVSLFRHGVLKTLYMLHSSKTVVIGDVKKMGTKEMLSKVLVADGILHEVREIARQNNIPHEVFVAVMGTMDIEMVLFTMEKRHKMVQSFPSMASIAHNAIMGLNDKAALQIQSPWQAAAKDLSQGSDASTALLNADPIMREFDAEGKMLNPDQPLHDAGFGVGVSVIRKQDKLVGTISFLGEPSKVMTHAGQVIDVPVSKLVEDWKPQTQQAKDDEEELCKPELSRCAADKAQAFRILVEKQSIIKELDLLSAKYPINVEKLKVMVKPREVYVRSACKKHELVLVPITLKVDHKKARDDEGSVPLAALDLGVRGDVRLLLNSSNQQPNAKKNVLGFVAPFWWITTSIDKDDCNMELHCFKDFSAPVARNFSALQPGDRLVLHRPAKDDVAEKEKPMSRKRKGTE